jgi:hypothetical protein
MACAHARTDARMSYVTDESRPVEILRGAR